MIAFEKQSVAPITIDTNEHYRLMKYTCAALIIVSHGLHLIDTVFPINLQKADKKSKHKEEASIMWNIIRALAIICIIVQIFYMKNEINQTTIDTASYHLITLIGLILYSILMLLLLMIDGQQDKLLFSMFMFVILQILILSTSLISPWYHILGSRLLIIIDPINYKYFYRGLYSEMNLGFDVKLKINITNQKITSINSIIHLSAYDANGNLKNQTIETLINSADNIKMSINSSDLNEIITLLKHIMATISQVDYDTLPNSETSPTTIDKQKYIIEYATRVNIITNNVIDRLINFTGSLPEEREIHDFIYKEIIDKFLAYDTVEMASLSKLIDHIVLLTFRTPVYMRQLYSDKTLFQEACRNQLQNMFLLYSKLMKLQVCSTEMNFRWITFDQDTNTIADKSIEKIHNDLLQNNKNEQNEQNEQIV